MKMQERFSVSVPSPSRPTTVQSRQSSPHEHPSEDRSSDPRSYTLLHDTDGRISHDSDLQIRIHPGSYDYAQAHGSWEPSTGRTSPTCVPSTHPSGLVATVEPRDNSSLSSSRLAIQQGDLRKSPADRRCTSLLGNWRWEILSMVTSLGLLAGIVITLGRYNLTQQPEWPYNININSLASVIAAVIVAQLGFILAEIISQLKWSWFKHPNPLQHLEDYDAASRGMIGSLAFLGRFATQPRAYLAGVAAFILVASAAIGPFTQQSIKTYACQRPLHNITASIPTASWINSSLIMGDSKVNRRRPNLKMMTAALEGLVGSANGSRQVPFDCPTGNCDFDPYSSLAYCSSCIDVTPHVQEAFGPTYAAPDIDYWNYTLPSVIPGVVTDEDYCQLTFKDLRGHPVLATKGATASSPIQFVICPGGKAAPKHGRPINFNILSMSWANCSQDHRDGMPNSPGCGSYPEQLPSLSDTAGLVAMNCTFGLCINDYTARVQNGVLDDRTTGRLFPEILSGEDPEFRMLKLPCTVDGVKFDRFNIGQIPSNSEGHFTTVSFDGRNVTVPVECVYETDEDVPWAIGEFLETDVFQPRGVQDEIGGCCGLNTHAKASWCNPWYLAPLYRDGRLTAETISADMESVARSISNSMRVVGSNAYRNGSGFAPGRVIQTTVCVRVDWPWLVLPATLVLLTGWLLVWVVITARRSQVADNHPVWKSSALVGFFHGIETRPRMPNGTANEHTAGPTGSPGEAENSTSSIPLPRSDTDENLMSLREMHTRAKKVVVKLDTAAPGRRGFVLVSEAQDEHRLVSSNKQDGARRSADSHHDGEVLPLAQLPSHGHIHGHSPSFLHVDLGVGFTPSVRDSLDRSRQQSSEDSLGRGAGTG